MGKQHNIIIAPITNTGYKSDSPHVNNPVNIIPSNRITMLGVEFPVVGVDNLGNSIVMQPNGEYRFPGDYVVEFPHHPNQGFFNQDGGACSGGGLCAGAWGAIGKAGTAVIGGVFSVFENKANNKSNQQIANGQFQTQKTIACMQDKTALTVNAGHDNTSLEVAQIMANAEANKPASQLSNSNIIMAGAVVVFIAATIGMFVYAAHKKSIQ